MKIDNRALIDHAIAARQAAYAPYSRYAVGAAVLTAGGRTFTGCNVENASYPAGICAERTAIFKAVSEGERRIVARALAAAPQEEQPPFGSYPAPCGICLQVLSEFAAPELRVLLAKSREDYQLCTMRDLFPKRFTAADLKKEIR